MPYIVQSFTFKEMNKDKYVPLCSWGSACWIYHFCQNDCLDLVKIWIFQICRLKSKNIWLWNGTEVLIIIWSCAPWVSLCPVTICICRVIALDKLIICNFQLVLCSLKGNLPWVINLYKNVSHQVKLWTRWFICILNKFYYSYKHWSR